MAGKSSWSSGVRVRFLQRHGGDHLRVNLQSRLQLPITITLETPA